MDTVERTIELDLTAEEAWRLVGTAEGWQQWLADEVSVDVERGALGTTFDDGVRRDVHIETVEDGRSVTFVWSTEDGDASRVRLALDQTEDGRRVVHISEEPLLACSACPLRAAERWELRACLLCLTALSASRV